MSNSQKVIKTTKRRYLFVFLLLIFSFSLSCTGNQENRNRQEQEESSIPEKNSQPLAKSKPRELASKKWWQNAIFYQIFPRSFKDSDGDGNGDFQGMTSKLDYLADLGITAIWLTPIFEAPSYHGYDYQKFYEVESDYGTMEDLENFLAEAEKRGIKVITDLVINHISNEHEWFKKSVQKEEPYTDYFIWRKEIPEGHWGKPWVEPNEEGYNQPKWVWFYNEDRGEYYYAAFGETQPDLNVENPAVVKELKKLTKFWIDKGFDGFRLDAIRYPIEEGPYPQQSDTQSTLDFWIDYNSFVKNIDSNIMLIGEVWTSLGVVAKYYNNGKGIDVCFDFEFGDDIINALNSTISKSKAKFGSTGSVKAEKTLVQAIQDNFYAKGKEIAPLSFYAPFLTNHDQERVMYELGDDPKKMKIAAVLLLTSIGNPYIYYGEEIGMAQTKIGDDQFKRAPMQWDDSEYANFTTGDTLWVDDGKWSPWITKHQPWWKEMWDSFEDKKADSVEGQKSDPDSLLNLYKKLIAIRKAYPEFSSLENESLEFIETKSAVLAFKRKSKTGSESLVMVNGSTKEPKEVKIDYLKGNNSIDLLDNSEITLEDGTITLAPGAFYILKVN